MKDQEKTTTQAHVAAEYGLCGDMSHLTDEEKQVATVIKEEVERKRQQLIEDSPESLTYSGGLLGAWGKTSIYVLHSWDEILVGNFDLIEVISERSKVSRVAVLDCALKLHSKNWQALFWLRQYEELSEQMWRWKLARALEQKSPEQAAKDKERQKAALEKEILSERGRVMALMKHQKSGTSDVKEAVLDCLRRNSEHYKSKAEFVRDMLDKFGDKVTAPKTIERYIDQSGIVVSHWRKRKTS